MRLFGWLVVGGEDGRAVASGKQAGLQLQLILRKRMYVQIDWMEKRRAAADTLGYGRWQVWLRAQFPHMLGVRGWGCWAGDDV